MKKKSKYLLIPFILIMGLFVQTTLSIDLFEDSGGVSLSVSEAYGYIDPGKNDCTSFGYRTWDSPISTSSGYDCLCVARGNVRNSCN
jgi:hypothetical protein